MDINKVNKELNLIQAEALIYKEHQTPKWTNEIPYIKFPENMEVKIVPNFAGSVIRFCIRDINNPDSYVSVYLDCYDRLAYVGEPYWEVYSRKTRDVERTAMNDIDGLIKLIQESL